MLKIENTEVMGWEHAIRGMRNPKNSWEKSDSGVCATHGPAHCADCVYTDCHADDVEIGTKYILGGDDLTLMTTLRNAGTDHRKFMRMITVYLDITAPLYWWKEFDTYKVGTVANSCSTMHKIAAKEFTLEDFSHEHLQEDSVAVLETVVHMAKELGDVAWYLAVSANAIGYDLETIMQMNVDKLKARYPDGFDAEHSLHRNQDDI